MNMIRSLWQQLGVVVAACAVAGGSLEGAVGSGGGDGGGAGDVLVVFQPGVGAAQARRCRERHGLELVRDFAALHAHGGRMIQHLRATNGSIAGWLERMQREPDVLAAEPSRPRRLAALPAPNDPYFGRQWALRNTGQTVNGSPGTAGADIRFLSAQGMAAPDAPETVIALLDSGAELTHLELTGRLWTHPGEIPWDGIDNDGNFLADDVHGYNFYDNNSNPSDVSPQAHGTQVAGAMVAAMNNSQGIAGASPASRVMVLRVTDAADVAYTHTIVGAIDYAVQMKARGVNVVAINASLAGGVYDDGEIGAIHAAGNAGIVFCCAAGNNGTNNDAVPNYPGNYRLPNMLVAAATDQRDNLASFSNYGATTVDLAAPGDNLYSTNRIWNGGAQAEVVPSLKQGTVSYQAWEMVYSGTTTGVSGSLVDCGKGLGPADFPPQVNGNIALIERGEVSFSAKVTNAMRAGAKGVVIYNTGDPGTTIYLSGPHAWIPGLAVSRTDGLALRAALPATVTITALPKAADNAYQYASGTSLATPLVSSAVALAAAHFPWETAAQRAARVRAAVTPLPALSGKVISGGRLDLARVIDADGDQLPDWWELRYFGSVGADPAADADGDGFTNLQEYRIGTGPTDPFSRLAITRAEVVANGAARDFRLVFPTAREVVYQVESSDGLATWQALGAPVAGTGQPHAATDPDAANLHPRRFYRVRILAP